MFPFRESYVYSSPFCINDKCCGIIFCEYSIKSCSQRYSTLGIVTFMRLGSYIVILPRNKIFVGTLSYNKKLQETI